MLETTSGPAGKLSMGKRSESRDSQTLPVLQTGSFSCVLGRDTAGGYGPSPLPRAQWLGSKFYREIAALVLNLKPRGFLRLARAPSRRFAYKLLRCLFARNALTRSWNFAAFLRKRYRRANVTYMPPLVFADPSSACNLRRRAARQG